LSKLLQTDINEQLLEIFGQFDLTFEKQEDYYFSNNQFPGITAQVFEMERFEDSVVVQVDIHLLFPNQTIIESFVSHAETIEEGMAEALAQFEVNILHLLIGAFWENGKKIENGVGYEQWEINGHRWQAVIGNYGYRGELPIEEIVNDTMFETIAKEIKSLSLDKDIYAIRTVYTNVGDGRKVTEALINNQPFAGLEAAIANLEWFEVDSFYNVRNLVLIMKLSD